MVKIKAQSTQKKAPRIAINGCFLDDVKTRLEYGYATGSTSLKSFPTKHHRAVLDEDAVTLRLPALTALQLYHDGVLPVHNKHPIELTIGDANIGWFIVEWLRCVPEHEFGDPVLIRFARVSQGLQSVTTDKEHCEAG